MSIYWESNQGRYAVATLSAPGALLDIANGSGLGGSVQFFSHWIPEDGAKSGPVMEQRGHQLFIRQGENAGQGVLSVGFESDGITADEIVLLILGGDDRSAGYDRARTAATPILQIPIGQNRAALDLTATATLSRVNISAPTQTLQGRARVQLSASATRLSHITPLSARVALSLNARHGRPQPPGALTVHLKADPNPAQPDVPERYLQVWFYGHPHQCQITVQVDSGFELTPAFIWQNPGTTAPAILKIPLDNLPGDGSTHAITVSVGQNYLGFTSARTNALINVHLPTAKPPQPTRINAVLLRQATADTPDLVEVTWTANSGVIISAHLRPQGWAMGQNPATLAGKTIPLGYGNNSENRMQFEGIGARFAFLTGQESPVYFSIAAIRNNVVGHALFTVHPLNIRALDGKPTPEQTPDQIAGTWQKVSYHEWLNAIASELGSDGPFYAQLAVYYTLIRIKNIIAQGGNVTLDDWGIFEARWSESKPVKGPAGTWYTQPGERSVAFVPSIGFVAGTKAGIVMTDAEAKALKP